MIIDVNAFYGAQPKGLYDYPLSLLKKMMDAHDIDKSVIYSITGMLVDVNEANRKVMDIAEKDDRFIPCGMLNPLTYYGVKDEIRRCSEGGMQFFRIFPVIHNYPLYPYRPLNEIFIAMEEYNGALIVSAMRAGAASSIELATRDYTFPIILVDMGYNTMAEAMTVAKSSPKFFIGTSKMSSHDAIQHLVEEVGSKKLLFASGAPKKYYNSALFPIYDAKISEDDKNIILGENFLELVKDLESRR